MIYDAVSQDPQRAKGILTFRFRFCVRPRCFAIPLFSFPPIAFSGSIPLNLRGTTDNTLYSMLSTVQANWGLKPLEREDTAARLVIPSTAFVRFLVDFSALHSTRDLLASLTVGGFTVN
ncbi:hypothetical protein B0H14DRAFT_3452561 [Mycena olivaceomarginata]|nr:hypothetical protein B0H14DRAFT_3452561 [Mycena olivaceomarginata]